MYNNDAPMLKYCQKLFIICCFSNFVSAFASIKQTEGANYILFCIEESLKIKRGNSIDFENAILKQVNKT